MVEFFGKLFRRGPSKESVAFQQEDYKRRMKLREKSMSERQALTEPRTEDIKKAVKVDSELMQELKNRYPSTSEEFDSTVEAKRIAETVLELEAYGKFPKGSNINGNPLRSVKNYSGHFLYPSRELDFVDFGSEGIYKTLLKHNIQDELYSAFASTIRDNYQVYLKEKYPQTALMTVTNTEDLSQAIITYIISSNFRDSASRDTRCVRLNFLLPKQESYKLLLLADKDPEAIKAFFWTAAKGAEGDKENGIPNTGIRKFNEVAFLDLSKIDPRLLNGFLNYQADKQNFTVAEYSNKSRENELLKMFDEGYKGSGNFVKVFKFGEQTKST